MGTSLNVAAWSTTAASNNTADTGLPTIADTMTPTQLDDTMRGIMAAVKRYVLDVGGAPAAVGGTADAITITTNQAISTGHQAAGFSIRFKAGGTNTGAVTVAVDGLTAAAVERMDGTALSAGDIISGGIYDIAYNATNGGYTLMTAAGSYAGLGGNTFTAAQTISTSSAGAQLALVSSEAGATAASLELYRNSATPAASDILFTVDWYGKDSAGNKQLYAQDRVDIVDATSGSEDGVRYFGVVTAGSSALELALVGAALYPVTNDGLSLGQSGNAFSDVFLASGAVLNFDASDVTVTHSADTLTVAGGSLASASVAITGGSITGITDLAIADGGTGASTATAAATNLGLGTGDSPQFAGINVGHASDTTITRLAAGKIGVEGNTICRIYTGTYTGDGATSKAITGVGFTPKYVKIWNRETVNSTDVVTTETTDTIVDDNGAGGAVQTFIATGGAELQIFITDAIIALGSDGFTVDDQGTNGHPNTSGQVYNYICMG